MPAEAAEFEVARRYVNLAAAAARNAALARPHQAISPQMVARAAVASAARAQAPGVYRMMMRSLGGPAVAARCDARPPAGRSWPAGTHIVALPRRRLATGAPAISRRPVPVKACDNFRLPGLTVRLRGPTAPSTPSATLPGHPIRLRLPGHATSGSQAAPAVSQRSGRGYSPYGRPRRYGSGYGGWHGPSASAEPWTDGDGGIPGDGFQASGRWVRRGRQIIILGA